ncbi:MAG: hypothetical protein ACPF9D_07690 [Owenweeksia sp.]
MNSLVIHIGPPKCGSSSIQHFLSSYKRPFTERTRFIKLNGSSIVNDLSRDKENIPFNKLLAKNLKFKGCLILSHESLFLKPEAIRKIALLTSSEVSQILITGYSRRQSDFVLSAYNQWGFRNPEVVKRMKSTLLQNHIDPLQFLGFERQLIASILNDFNQDKPPVMDWNRSYVHIEELVSSFNNTDVRAGILPGKGSSRSLIQHFSKMANLTLRERYKSVDRKKNVRFNTYLTEAVNNAAGMDLDIPDLHSNNDFFRNTADSFSGELEGREFLSRLKDYTDAYFHKSNMAFCRKYDLNEEYFKVSGNYSHEEILEVIKQEEQKRIKDNTMIRKYRQISGMLAEAFYKYHLGTREDDGQ